MNLKKSNRIGAKGSGLLLSMAIAMSSAVIPGLPVAADTLAQGASETDAAQAAQAVQMKQAQLAAVAQLQALQAAVPQGSIVDTGHQLYTYEEMIQDLTLLQALYPDLISVQFTAATSQGRQIPEVIMGNPAAPRQIMITASMHAREYITTPLVMKMIEDYAIRFRNGESYQNIPYQELFQNVCLVIVPMVNPDGVSISQLGVNGVMTDSSRQWVAGTGSRAVQIKANANGVDINRNFPVGWADAEQHEDSYSRVPSLEFYKGPAPASEAETQNVMYIAAASPIVMYLNYHTMGNIFYYSSAVTTPAAYASNVYMAQLVRRVTGYPGQDSSKGKGANGSWADYVIGMYQKPSCTIEVGDRNPVPASEFPGIYQRNKELWSVLMYTVYNGQFQ